MPIERRMGRAFGAVRRVLLGSVLAACAALGGAAMAEEQTALLGNPGFEEGLEGWVQRGPAEFTADAAVTHGGKQSARITIAPEVEPQYQWISVVLPVKPGEEHHLSFWARTGVLTDGGGAYGVLEYLDGERRVGIEHTRHTTVPEEWQCLTTCGTVPPEANRMRVALLLHAHGSAWFDDVKLGRGLFPMPDDGGPVELTLRPREVISDRWQGFGAQGDLFHGLERTRKQGFTDADRELVRRRIRSMRPQMVRLLFNVTAWESERGKRTPESEGMRDLRDTLAFYQELGTDVQLTEWGYGLPAWCRATKRSPHPEERRAFTDSFVSAVQYLRRECGITHLRYVTLYNEPNGGGGISWEDYAAVCRSLDASLREAGLRREVAILGPDETGSEEWLARATAELDDVIDYYDSHNYTGNTGPDFAAWLSPRIARMPRVTGGNGTPPRKRLLVCEFGMQAGMSTYASPHNHRYEYGFFLADAAVTAANEGASAMLMWCLSDAEYGQRMKWGLWRFRDEGWEPRPGFYSWSLLTRYTERESTVHRLDCPAPGAAAVAFRVPNGGPWTLLVVNRSSRERALSVRGLAPRSRWEPFAYREDAIPTPDREMIRPGKAEAADGEGVLRGSLPPRSFLLWREVRAGRKDEGGRR